MKKFENPIMEVAYFEAKDIVTTSGQGSEIKGSNIDDANVAAEGRLASMQGAAKISVVF